MQYNVFYFTPGIPDPYKLLVISQEELHRFVQAYRKGDITVFIRGELVNMDRMYGVQIFDCSKNTILLTEGAYRLSMQMLIFMESKNGAEELRGYFLKHGIELTNHYIRGTWGYEKGLVNAPPVTAPPVPEKMQQPVNPQQQKQPTKQPQQNIPQKQQQTNPQQVHPQTQQQATATPVFKNNSTQTAKRIFISHSSKDSELVNAFCDLILDNALGIDTKSQLFNTSLDGSKPLSGEDFRDRIKDELQNADVVLQFITQNYKDSGVCMNEMGAAWVLNAQVIPLILEPGAYDVGFINSTIQQVKLWDADALFEFVDNHKGRFFPAEVTVSRLNKKIKAFVKVVGEVYGK